MVKDFRDIEPRKPIEAYHEMLLATERHGTLYSYCIPVHMQDYLIETDLFTRPGIEAYSRKNLGQPAKAGDEAYFNAERGGAQGDYSERITTKIANVIDCLEHFP